jgi:hypothetical protein
MSASIALMCKSHNYKTNSANNVYSVGNWVIAENRRKDLLGQNVVLTESQKSPAYLGGTIVGFVPTQNGKKCEVIFQVNESLTGNTDAVEHQGWGSGRGVCYI